MSTKHNDDLGQRMKAYEHVSQIKLTNRMPMVIRIDGKAFHTFTKGFDKPWDKRLVHLMNKTAHALMKEIQGAKLAYIQSDEISILATDYDNLASEAWFDKKVQKICSVAASIATAAFNQESQSVLWETTFPTGKFATFDARCFAIPKEDVCNYFLWRQKDAVRNSIQGLGQKNFSHKELHGKNCNQIQEMLWQNRKINWNDCETWQKRGWCVTRETVEMEETQSLTDLTKTKILSNWNIPSFSGDRNFVEQHTYIELNIDEIEETSAKKPPPIK